MKVLIGCDVDPVLPPVLKERPSGDIWSPLDNIISLIGAMKDDLPVITWLIRCDESVRFSTGDYDSGYTSRRQMWTDIINRGHELGWHMHLFSPDPKSGSFAFDPRPSWLEAAHSSLSRHYPVRATRTGWDYGSTFLFSKLEHLGVTLDFSALPGLRVWHHHLGPEVVNVDWLRCPQGPFHPSTTDYQQAGAESLNLLEVPIALFPNSPLGMMKRYAWRLRHGCLTLRGLNARNRLLTDTWGGLPESEGEILAFFFHPEDLSPQGIRNVQENVERIRSIPGAEFMTAGQIRDWYDSRPGPAQ